MQRTQTHPSKSGFTLVELAIVIVIIGLIIGGVLVGQDMIKAAEIRATISQWEEFNAATNTFRDKYGYIPGDINQDRALEYGFFDRTGTAAAGNGDGNGLLQGCGQAAADGIVAGCETTLFWRDLNDAELVDGFFQVADDNLAQIANEELVQWFPEAAIGRGNFWLVYSAEGKNWFRLTGVTSTNATGDFTLTESLTPFEAFNIDRKVDDSRPLFGGVRARDGTAMAIPDVNATPAVSAPGVCVENGNNTYNQIDEDDAQTPACNLRMRAMF